MKNAWKNPWVTLITVITVSAVFVKYSEARAKAGFFDDSAEGDDFWASNEKKEDSRSVLAAASVPVVPAMSVASDPHANHPPSHHISRNDGNWDSSGGMSSANVAAHNESCGPNAGQKSCMRNANMECNATDGTGRCACITGWVYVRSTESCWKVVQSSQDECAHDVQCQAGRFGELSRCEKVSARCQCYDIHQGGKRATIRVEGVCYIKKSVGDLCNTNEECDQPIEGDAYCQSGEYEGAQGGSYSGSCQCREAYTWYKPLNKCLLKSTKEGDECVVSQQCRDGSLGKLSWCNTDTVKCECWPFGGIQNQTEVIYYEKLRKCFLKKEYNDTCTEDDECRANLGPDVVCDITGEYTEKVCHCPEGKVCRNSGFSTKMIAGSAFSALALASTATIMGMSMRLNCMFSWLE